MVEWTARFKNKKYDINCIVLNTKDYTEDFPFKLVIDGVTFQSYELIDWELQDNQFINHSELLKNFELFKDKYLQNFVLNINIDTLIFDTELRERIKATLQVTYNFGKTYEKDSIRGCNHATLNEIEFLLTFGDETFKSNISSPWFEDSLVSMCKLMSNRYQLVNCFGCAYSDYSPYGGGNIGNLYCFYKIKDKYLTVGSKYATSENEYTVLEAFEEKLHFPVQEVDLCENFSPRISTLGGYRGQIYNQ